jgi:hypothetical protein
MGTIKDDIIYGVLERPRIFTGQRKRTGLFMEMSRRDLSHMSPPPGKRKGKPNNKPSERQKRALPIVPHTSPLYAIPWWSTPVKSPGDGKREETSPPGTSFNVFEFTYVAVFFLALRRGTSV